MEQDITLTLYEEKYREELLAFQLPPDQVGFTGLPAETLEAALRDEHKYAVVIAEGGRAVGFFILHTGNGIADFYEDFPGVILLRAFLVNYPFQRQGIAMKAMSLLPQFVRSRFASIREVVLAVNEKNRSAEQLYIRAGFVDQGLRRTGKLGIQKILHYKLTPASVSVPMTTSLDNALCQRLTAIFEGNKRLMSVFHSAGLLFPHHPYYIGAGCLVQTVWNELTNRSPEYGIGDIDIIYYDGADFSLAAENKIVSEGERLYSGLPFPVDIKNEARVHLWYRDKFGIELQPYTSLEAAIDTWPTTATSLGARLNADGSWHIYAPFGLQDLFNLVVRPNKVLINESIYYKKALKWKNKWPELIIVPWGE